MLPRQTFHGNSKNSPEHPDYMIQKFWELTETSKIILSVRLPNKDHRIPYSDFCPKPSNLWFKQSISTSPLSSFDARMSNEALTTSHAVKNWLFYRLPASLYHCLTFCSLLKDIKIFKHFCLLCQNSQTIKKRENRDSEAQKTKQVHRKRRITEHLYAPFCCE